MPFAASLREREDIDLRRYEALFEHSKRTFDFYLKRWDENDAKVGRFITMLLALLGGGVFSIRAFLKITAVAEPDYWSRLLFAAYVLFAACGVMSFGFFLRALSYQRFEGPSTNPAVVLPYFDTSRYVDALVGLSRSYLVAAQEIEDSFTRTLRAAAWGYGFFVAAVVFGLLSALVYASINVG